MSRFCIKALFALCAAIAAASCIDMSPLQEQAQGDAGADASFLPDASPYEASCRACVFGEGSACQPQWAACEAEELCRFITECGIERGCLPLLALQEQTVCTIPCIEQAGIKSAFDRAILAGLALNACKINNCAAACGGG